MSQYLLRFLRILSLATTLALVVIAAVPVGVAQAQGTPTRLVLVVANNRGSDLGRADLRYADDDGAKYRELFRTAAARPEDVVLLTRFDRDTAKLFEGVPDGPPTRGLVEQKVGELAARAAELRSSGQPFDFVFVYAGHGDIDRGRGFIQLEDGTFTADDLAALIKRIDAPRAHVVLDSCNSLFLVAPRKPGGRHVSTSDEAIAAIRQRIPRVGVFLSTSADGEVFEWSELGAGIFSHAVRSGLAGAADANGDGAVSYAELRAFVETATRDVKNPRYRPKVFARGPEGEDGISLFVPKTARARRIVVDGPTRTTLRDADDIPWVDAHVEKGSKAELLVLPSLAEHGSQEILDVRGDAQRVIRRTSLDGATNERTNVVAARGPSEVFRTLFVRPFGPHAMEDMPVPDAPESQAYGLSRDDVTRFATLLRQVDAAEKARRKFSGLGLLAGGVAAGGAGAFLLVRDAPESAPLGLSYVSVGIALAAVSPVVAFTKGKGEQLSASFERDLENKRDPGEAVAVAETRLDAIAREEARNRLGAGVVGGLAAGGMAALVVTNELRDQPDVTARPLYVSSFVISATFAFINLQPTPIERLAELWRSDPTRSATRVSWAPLGPHGPGLSLAGSF